MLSARRQSRISLPHWMLLIHVLMGLMYLSLLWQQDASGLSLYMHKVIEHDFSNFWLGSKLAWSGQGALLFDDAAFRATLRSAFSPEHLDSEWRYPPHLLLFGFPFQWLDLRTSYVLWSALNVGAMALVLHKLGYRGLLIALVCLSPSAFTNQIFGQYGMVCSALMIAGLMWSRERPILAGICLGLLTIKPHFGVLIPFCLLASRQWKTIAVASCVTLGLIAASCAAFGVEVWSQYINYTMPMMRETLNMPYPQGFHSNSVTGFVLLRAFGASLELAYVAQAIMTLLCAGAAYVLWRDTKTTLEYKVALTALLTVPASLYLYQYDVGFVAFAAALLALKAENRAVRWMAWCVWAWPLYSHLVVVLGGLPPFYVILVSALIYLVIKDKRALT